MNRNPQHASERDCPTFGRPHPGGPALRLGPLDMLTRCYCIGDTASSKSKTTATETGGTDQAQVTTGGSAARDNSVALNIGSKAIVQTGTRIGNIGGDLTIGIDGSDVGALVDKFVSASAQQIEAFTSLADKQQQAVAELAKKEATSDEENQDSKVVWIAGAALAAAVALTWRK